METEIESLRRLCSEQQREITELKEDRAALLDDVTTYKRKINDMSATNADKSLDLERLRAIEDRCRKAMVAYDAMAQKGSRFGEEIFATLRRVKDGE